MTTEIPQKLWSTFCDHLKEWHRGAVSIRWTDPDGSTRDVVEDAPLQAVALRHQVTCNDVVTIEAGRPEERPLQHRIVEPIRIVLRTNGESGRYKQLEILSEEGKTEVTFNPGIDPDLLEKLAA
jgi:hypothetical protein